MRTTLGSDDLDRLSATLRQASADFEAAYPGDSGSRQPVHTVYGGAHLFKRDTAAKLGDLAVRFMDQHMATPEQLTATLGIQGPEGTNLADTVHRRAHGDGRGLAGRDRGGQCRGRDTAQEHRSR